MHLSTFTGATKKNVIVMAKVIRLSDLYKSVAAAKCGRSKWENGKHYLALTIIEMAEEPNAVVDLRDLEATLLNGAADWSAYCYGGGLIVSNLEIAELLCTPSELRRSTAADGSLKDPNKRETWMDVQARAALQAWWLIRDCAATIAEERDTVTGRNLCGTRQRYEVTA